MRAQQCYYSSETMATCIVVDAVRYERFSKVICASSECMERFGISHAENGVVVTSIHWASRNAFPRNDGKE